MNRYKVTRTWFVEAMSTTDAIVKAEPGKNNSIHIEVIKDSFVIEETPKTDLIKKIAKEQNIPVVRHPYLEDPVDFKGFNDYDEFSKNCKEAAEKILGQTIAFWDDLPESPVKDMSAEEIYQNFYEDKAGVKDLPEALTTSPDTYCRKTMENITQDEFEKFKETYDQLINQESKGDDLNGKN